MRLRSMGLRQLMGRRYLCRNKTMLHADEMRCQAPAIVSYYDIDHQPSTSFNFAQSPPFGFMVIQGNRQGGQDLRWRREAETPQAAALSMVIYIREIERPAAGLAGAGEQGGRESY